ncbi:MAG TPA: zinc metalloprotease [Spirillospora sp.]
MGERTQVRQVRAASETKPDDECDPGLAARAFGSRARPHDHADLGAGQVSAMLADLRRTLHDRFGTSDEDRLDSLLRESGLGELGPAAPDERRKTQVLVVPVRFHVIHSGRRGLLSKQAAYRQVATLNAAYGGRRGGADTGVRFRLTSFGTTNNSAWFYRPRRYEGSMKRRLRRGGRASLNIYTAAVGADVLGFSTFPQWYRKRPHMDGVVVDYRSLPGGSFSRFDRGYTAVHEIGHWLGLFHTFENGCRPPGDGVADTPYEARPADGCPLVRDTCPQRGRDPVHNFMNYAQDACMSEFTAGQGRRIRVAWAAYRSPRSARLVGLGTGSATGTRSVGAAG